MPGDEQVAVVGTTNWGFGLSTVLARAGQHILLLTRDRDEADVLRQEGRHARLRDAMLSERVRVQAAGDGGLASLRVLVLAVPAQSARENVRRLAPLLAPATALLSASKGLEEQTGKRMSEVIKEEAGRGRPVAVLSGPNLAPELLAGLPAAAVLASTDLGLAAELQRLLATPQLRLYTSRDVIGVEFGGALKNVIALAAGLCEGLGYGDNAKAALLTRGLAEIVRLGVVLGADPITFAGLSGLGDLVATCSSPLSRNHRAGRLLAEGLPRAEVEARVGEVIEGFTTTAAAYALARCHGVSMPITEQLYQVLYDDRPPRQAAEALLLRDLTEEPPI
jgi:glycerol-3-phosphate dehydrogenase (NAD(P)+)